VSARPAPGRSTVYAPRHAVATSQPLATSAGLAALRDGGTAVDAAVTAAAVLSVTEPHMTGLGGDLFAIVWSESDGSLYGLDASGRSGSRADADLLKAEGFTGVPPRDARAVTVPGAVGGWEALLARFGRFSPDRALERRVPGQPPHRAGLGRGGPHPRRRSGCGGDLPPRWVGAAGGGVVP